MYLKLKYIQISIDIYKHISYNGQNQKKGENNKSTMKTHQTPNKWQYLTSIKVSFSNQNFQNDIVTPTLPYDNGSCIIIHNYKTHFNYFCLYSNLKNLGRSDYIISECS